MNGMAKGTLKAGGNIVAKFLENATASAGGYVSTESILHSNVIAATEIQVTGKRGFITGGHVRAGQKIEVKTLGAMLGAPTVVEVGVDPEKKAEYMKMQKEVSEIVKNIRSLQPILANFAEKKSKGVRFTPDQINYLRNTAASMETVWRKRTGVCRNCSWSSIRRSGPWCRYGEKCTRVLRSSSEILPCR